MNFLKFLPEVKQELQKVTWPSKSEVTEASTGVVVFVAIIAIYFWVIDYILSWILKAII